MRRRNGDTTQTQQRSHGPVDRRRYSDNRRRLLVLLFAYLDGFATIKTPDTAAYRIGVVSYRNSFSKKLPTRLSPNREVSAVTYENSLEIQTAIASSVNATSIRNDSLKQGFIRHHLLSMNPASNHQRLLAGFVFVSENMQPRKAVSPVYTEGA